MYADRHELAAVIAERLRGAEAALTTQWNASRPVRHFYLDDLIDPAWARQLSENFPPIERMLLRSSIRERKRVGIHVSEYDHSVGDALFAFQEPEVVEVVSRITGHRAAVADPTLYASGVSVMGAGDFLNPHIDNSHDGDRKRYRVLNLLFYVSPDWKLTNGGNLELWDEGVHSPTVIESRFNRLVVMETNETSWHSVNQVRVSQARRCVSNYYFSEQPPGGKPHFHVTTFAGRPEEPLKRLVLRVMDGIVLNTLGRRFPALTMRTKHRLKPTASRP